MGHQGVDRTASLIWDRFYWPYMQKRIMSWGDVCALNIKDPFMKQEHHSRTWLPLNRLNMYQLTSCILISVEVAMSTFWWLLTISHALRKLMPQHPNQVKQSPKRFSKIMPWDSDLHQIHHDQGGEFENQLFKQLEAYCGVAGSRTTPYHLHGNEQVERFKSGSRAFKNHQRKRSGGCIEKQASLWQQSEKFSTTAGWQCFNQKPDTSWRPRKAEKSLGGYDPHSCASSK